MNSYIKLLSIPKLQNKWFPQIGDRYIAKNQQLYSHLLYDSCGVVDSAWYNTYVQNRLYLTKFYWIPRIEDYIMLQKFRPFKEVIEEALVLNFDTLEECMAVQYLNWLNRGGSNE